MTIIAPIKNDNAYLLSYFCMMHVSAKNAGGYMLQCFKSMLIQLRNLNKLQIRDLQHEFYHKVCK